MIQMFFRIFQLIGNKPVSRHKITGQKENEMSACYKIGYENVNGIVSIPEDNSIASKSWLIDELEKALFYCNSLNEELQKNEVFCQGYYVVVDTPFV